MSILQKCVRFSWDVVSSSPHSWGGTNDRSVESLVRSRVDKVTDDYKKVLPTDSIEAQQVAVPLMLMLRNTQHPLILERNFWWNKNEARASYYPTSWGEFLTSKERDAVSAAFQLKPEHKFVLHMLTDFGKEAEFISRLVMSHAYTTYTVPMVYSLNGLANLIANSSFGSADNLLDEIRTVPLLIITDVFGECESLRRAVGSITEILKDRMYNGRATVFTDAGHLHTGHSVPSEGTVSPFGQTKQSLMKALRDNVSLVSVLSTPIASFLFGGMTYVMNSFSFTSELISIE